MNELPMSIKKAAARYKPIEANGLTLYPVLVREYETFLIARPALEVMHQSLPVAMMRIPLLSALYQLDYEAVIGGRQHSGLFFRALIALALSLRLGEDKPLDSLAESFQILISPEDPTKLLGLRFTDGNGDTKVINPADYALLRQIIAVQNGVKIESDKANPDIVRAEKLRAESDGIQLDTNLDDWISAVSALTGVSEDEIDSWPILRFQRRSESFRRILDYLVCGIGECSGMVSWKNGNPHPHPFFNRISEGSGILKALGGSADGKPKAAPEAAIELADISNQLKPTKRSEFS